jgi:hypothetical protein
MYGPTIFTERVMPSGFVEKTFCFGALADSAADAQTTKPAQKQTNK